LVDQLEELADRSNPEGRAVLAHLRRGLSANPTYVLARVGWLLNRVPDGYLLDAILTAALFALAKGACRNRKDHTLGRAFGSLPGIGDSASIERRFIDLLDTDRQDLDYKLRQAITLIAPHELPLDWGLLLVDLHWWDHPDRKVQKRWARDFWAAGAEENTESADKPQVVESSAKEV
jgi:CRISPR type I-E-associated protein CasB/Cse2